MNLSKAANIEALNPIYVREVDRKIPAFRITEPSPEQWNRKAREQNIRMFIEVHKRQPVDYEEVLTWARSIGSRKEENHSAGNTMAFISSGLTPNPNFN